MPDELKPSPAPWRFVWATPNLAMLLDANDKSIGAINGDNPEADAELTCLGASVVDLHKQGRHDEAAALARSADA